MATAEKKAENAAQANDSAKSLIVLYPHADSGNAYLQQLRATLQAEATLKLHDGKNEKDIAEQVQAAQRGLMIFCIRHKEDLTLVLNAMTALGPLVKSKALRVIGVNEINHSQIPPMLMKRGCADVFSSKLNPKALRHKINQALRIVATYSVPNAGFATKDAVAAETKKALAPAQTAAQAILRKTPAITLASDCWLVRKERDIRRVQGRWIVDLIGPGPSSGLWEEPEDAAKSQLTYWVWKPKALADGSVSEKEFVKDEGAWHFFGRKPEFIWDLGRWRFLGDTMSLVFRKGQETLATRFKMVDGAMEYAENSPQAKQKLPLIIKTIENEVRFRNEAKAKAATNEKFKDEKKQAATIDKEFAEEEAREGNIINWEKDDAEGGAELEIELEKAPEGKELQITLDKPPEGKELNLRLGRPEEAEATSDGFAMQEAPEEHPFNQAPQPKLKIWIAPAQPRDGEKYRPLEANPIELAQETLMLEIQQGQFKAGETVILVMDDGLMKPESKKRIKGTLDKVEAGEGTDTVTLQVDPQIMTVLDPIHKAIEIRQKEIMDFLKAARGW